jgi:asparagine synthase (glutamine-hydrolysing)
VDKVNVCGIFGAFSSDSKELTPELIGRMAKALMHRGPDDEGYLFCHTSSGLCEPRAGDDTVKELRYILKHSGTGIAPSSDLVLGHRRLAIIDISSAGHQPMSNEDRTIWVIHNGEIYNFLELREELKSKGHRFESNTDTEVIVHSYEEWGVECFNRFNGMWAFAIWDSRQRKLLCSRDRFGVKPFYYHFDGTRLLFASEIKAIMEAKFVERKPDYQTIFDYLAYQVENCTEDTFFVSIKQLRGGHYLEFMPSEKELKIQRYYDINLGCQLSGLRDDEYAKRFYELFEDSVRLRLISDVPIGTCLSGGLDSSSIACVIDKLMRENGVKLPGIESIQKTFSARYDENKYDEGFFINEVIKRTSADAHYTYPRGDGLLADLSKLIWHQEEPFVTTSIYAGWEVFKLAKQCGCKVVLDGQGADELMAGYDGYYAVLFCNLLRTLQWPRLVEEFYSHVLKQGMSAAGQNMLKTVYHLLPLSSQLWIRKNIQQSGNPCLSKEFSEGFVGFPFRDGQTKAREASFFDYYLYEAFISAILPGLLRYEDKNSMAHSIEARVPFLDWRLVELVFAMPWNQKISHGTRKFVLRNAMRGILPDSVLNRQDKIGFSTPEDKWFRKDLRDEFFEVINSPSFKKRPFFDITKLQDEFKAYQEGRKNISSTVWRWINLELWLRMFVDV